MLLRARRSDVDLKLLKGEGILSLGTKKPATWRVLFCLWLVVVSAHRALYDVVQHGLTRVGRVGCIGRVGRVGRAFHTEFWILHIKLRRRFATLVRRFAVWRYFNRPATRTVAKAFPLDCFK